MSNNSTLGKLSFSSKFFGRSYETEQLRDVFLRLGNDPLAVLVGGYSGTGKTRLVQHVVDELRAQSDEVTPFFFCSGKADELLSTDPFSSIVTALAQLVKELEPDERTVLRERILGVVGSEGKVLTNLLPELEELIGEQPETQASTTSSSMNRFTYLFQALIKAICSPEKPLVMYLDDLQWTDASSLALIRSLLTDKDLHHFLFIGSYRDNEVDETHPLTLMLRGLRRQGKAYVTLSLGNLTLEETTSWVQDTLRLDEVDDLVEALYAKTHGNVFYLKASMQQLEQKQILRFSFATCTWEWDKSRLKKEVEVSDNVVSLVLENLQRTDEALQAVMVVAAHLRSTFSLTLLYDLMRDRMDYTGDMESLIAVLEKGVTSGFLENTLGSDMYQFVHDRIRQASLLLAKEEGRHIELSLVVGQYLLTKSDPEEWMSFAAMDHLNSVPLGILNDQGFTTVELAKLNLRAGKKAAGLSAYAPAASYYRRGVELVEEVPRYDRWLSEYDLCLDLYSSAAEIEFCIGSFDVGDSYTTEVFANAISPLDKVRAYTSIAESLGKQDRHMDALDIYEKILNVLGEKLKGVNLIQVLRRFRTVKAMFAAMTPDEIAELPVLADPIRVEVVETLTRTSIRAVWGGKKLLALWVTLRTCEIAVNEGVCAASVAGISTFAAMLASYEPPILDVKLGRKIGYGARKLTTKLGARSMETRILFNASRYDALRHEHAR